MRKERSREMPHHVSSVSDADVYVALKMVICSSYRAFIWKAICIFLQALPFVFSLFRNYSCVSFLPLFLLSSCRATFWSYPLYLSLFLQPPPPSLRMFILLIHCLRDSPALGRQQHPYYISAFSFFVTKNGLSKLHRDFN